MNSALLQAAAVGAGGFIGALLRYLLGTAVNRHWHFQLLPLGTVVVNLLGCLLIGMLAGLADNSQTIAQPVRLFLVVGLLGGFTTFSTFAYEGLQLLRDGSHGGFLLYVGSQLLLGLLLVWLGYRLVTGR
ncbi:MAG: fluoride efflux transporter CrcB [Wenzhouxiangellaceae bacterium]